MTSPETTLEAARAVLEPGERLVWADRPDPEALARSKLAQVVRGVLGLAAIAGFLWFSFLPHWPPGIKGVALGIFLVGAGLYALWLTAAQAVARRAAARTLYAVTDRRVMILEDWPFARQRSFTAPELDEAEVVPLAGDRGNVIFVNHKLPWWQRSAGGGYRIEALFGIEGAAAVAGQIEALRRRAGDPTRIADEET